jgi:formylglycine-generating enzyme required for sulfatase activity
MVFSMMKGKKMLCRMLVIATFAVLLSTGANADFKDCPDCPDMVVIPPGSFRMGDLNGGGGANEKPVHRVDIGYSFAVGKYEVTFAQWDACVAGSGCNGYRPKDEGWGRGNRPVIYVSWKDAQSYVQWLSRTTGANYRLLSESEWEYVARAGTGTKYPWGNGIGSNNANCVGCGSRWDRKQTAPVGSFGANGFGLHDTAGNVRELTQDCYNENYGGAPSDGTARTTDSCSVRVLRGGHWSYGLVRSAVRFWRTTAARNEFMGFRIARTLSR